MKLLSRTVSNIIRDDLNEFPVTAIVGPRQVGKSTIVKQLLQEQEAAEYLDLERPSDLRKLSDPELYFQSLRGKLICIDEIQCLPDLFPVIRSLVDEWGAAGHFLITGSASPELLRQSSESLAGRISYHYLTPLSWNELNEGSPLENYLLRGGFPRSILAKSNGLSFRWRQNFISTFLETDLSFWSKLSRSTMERLWQMLAHLNGQQLNHSTLGRSLSVSNVTVRHYIDLLTATFMVTLLPPYLKNIGKRIVKAPKIYIADTGITHALLGIETYDTLLGHPVVGSSWEALVIQNVKANFPQVRLFYYRTSHGAEVDLVIELHGKIYAVECKYTLAPTLTKGNYNALEDIRPHRAFVVAPVATGWPMTTKINVVSLTELLQALHKT